MEGVLGGWEKEVKGLRSTGWQLQNNHGDVKHSIRNIVHNLVITAGKYGARRVLELLRGTCTKYMHV